MTDTILDEGQRNHHQPSENPTESHLHLGELKPYFFSPLNAYIDDTQVNQLILFFYFYVRVHQFIFCVSHVLYKLD